MRISQCEYAEARMSKFTYFLKRHNLHKYSSPTEPAIFFGMYGKHTLNTLANHKNLAIIVWRGSDIISNKQRLQSVLAMKDVDIRHVAISSFIAKDLEQVGVKYYFLPLSSTKVEDLGVSPLGNELYAYVPKKRANFYGESLVKAVSKRCKYKINIASSTRTYTRNELVDIYHKCFLGLRLTKHDGIANQVIEMGMMGRRCIHNGSQPSCIQWKNVDDILKSIEKESQKIGTMTNNVAKKTKEYSTVNSNWLHTDYWR